MSRNRNPVFTRRVGGRKQGRRRIRLIVYAAFIAVTLVAALAGLAINKHIEHVWEAHFEWLERQQKP